MKTLIKFTIITIMALFFVGCAARTPQNLTFHGQKVDNRLEVVEVEEGDSSVVEMTIDRRRNPLDIVEILETAVNYANHYDYKYMAIVRKGFNNLTGMPINTFKAINQYRSVASHGFSYNGRGDPLQISKGRTFKLHFFKEKIPGLFLFNINDLDKEMKAFVSYFDMTEAQRAVVDKNRRKPKD